MTRIPAIALALTLVSPAYGQDARIVARGASVEVLRDGQALDPGAVEVRAGDSIRTPARSFAVLAAEPGIRFTLGPGSTIALVSLGALPSIRIDQGSVHVRTGRLAVRVESPHGGFTLAEAPGEAAWEIGGGQAAVRVLAGAVTMTGADPAAVVFRGEPDRAVRTYRAGFVEPFIPTPPYPFLPNVYVTDPWLQYDPALRTRSRPHNPRPGPDLR